MSTIYAQLVAAGVPVDNHYSDLYALVTDESAKIVRGYSCASSVRRFRSNIDGKQWFDIPFAFDPYWEAKQNAGRK